METITKKRKPHGQGVEYLQIIYLITWMHLKYVTNFYNLLIKKKRLTSISGDKTGARVSPHTAKNYESEKMLSIIRECQSNYSEVLAHVC